MYIKYVYTYMRNRLNYLNYIMYIILIILLYILILIVKILNTQEGFEHKGNSFIADTSKKEKKPESSILLKILKPIYTILQIVSVALIQIPSKYLFSFGGKLLDIFSAILEYANAHLNRGQEFIKDKFDNYAGGFSNIGVVFSNFPEKISSSIRESTQKIKDG